MTHHTTPVIFEFKGLVLGLTPRKKLNVWKTTETKVVRQSALPSHMGGGGWVGGKTGT